MIIKKEWKKTAGGVGLFLLLFWLQVIQDRFSNAVGVFIRQEAVMKHLGARAKKVMAYGVASVSGSILAVCSCTVLPLFAGIWRMGAGLGPACAFTRSVTAGTNAP